MLRIIVRIKQLYFFNFLFISILFIGCNKQERDLSLERLSLSVTLDEAFIIGNPEDSEEGQRFISPAEVRTDHSGNIYVSDKGANAIFVFDSEGKFLNQIGARGEGPGEFRHISAFDINQQNELIIYDSGNRRIKKFSTSGEVLETYIPSSEYRIWPEYVRQVDEGGYLLLNKLINVTGEDAREQDYFLSKFMHHFDDSFGNWLESFGKIDSFLEGSYFEHLYIGTIKAGHFWPSENGDIWFVPGLYDGLLFKFKHEADGWRLSLTINGYTLHEKPVDLTSNSEEKLVITSYAGLLSGTHSGKVMSESLGVFTLNDGRLIHISGQIEGNKRITLIELFNVEGELVGIGELENFTFSGKETGAFIKSIWKDIDDRFYVIDVREEPLLRIGHLKGIY